MTALLAEFETPDALKGALARVGESGHTALDAFTPYPVEGLDEGLGIGPSRIRQVMLAGGVLMAAFAFGLQYYSAVYDYPLNLGGRPLNSWPAFLLVPFEVGILVAAIAGAVAFLYTCSLPRLHHPLFEIPGFERATQDRFFLLAGARDESGATLDLRHLLENAGAVVVTELREP